MLSSRWQQLRGVFCAVLLSNFSSAQKLNSKQWLHNHCKAYKADYAPLVRRLLSRYQGGIKVADVLNSKLPHGRSEPTMDNARPVVYLVNNTLHYADSKMAMRESRGLESAGFSVYFMPVIKRYSRIVCSKFWCERTPQGVTISTAAATHAPLPVHQPQHRQGSKVLSCSCQRHPAASELYTLKAVCIRQ